ncbi:DNA polymerase subunit gamma-2, mitochondrial-like [Babylonia areolata]|uniref:DNA polymerase subunit gamma-2, mitochondrial-like n=1 Tax=Babylonia areolata TaxID=304850 RepID=UPI003FD1B203
MSDPRVLRFIQLLVNRGFVEDKSVTVSGLQKRLFRFGPLGALLRKNILKQWWDAVVLEQPNTYCVENPIFVPHSDALRTEENKEISVLQNFSLRKSLSPDCQAAYLSALSLNGGNLPVSVASCGQCFQYSHDLTGPHTGKLLSNGVDEMQLLLQHYSPPVNVAQISDYWLRTRLRWWKHFCSKPSKLSTSNPTQTEQVSEENSETVITYDFPWGAEPVERISSFGDAPVREIEAKSGVSHQGRYHRKTFHPHVIECQTSLEQCMSVFLTDSFREREVKRKGVSQNHGEFHYVLQLHSQLSPYQAALSVTGSRASEVCVLVDHVAKELREAGISVLNTPNSGSMESQYRRNDELGVPYTVVISDQTLDTGIISIRDRDTRLKQKQHISKLQSLLSKSIHAQDLD